MRSSSDPLTDDNDYVPLVGAPHLHMDSKALNSIQIVQLLRVKFAIIVLNKFYF